MLSPPAWIGGENYQRLLTDDPLFFISLRNTALYVLLSVPATLAAGLGLALLLNRKLPGMGFFRTVFFLPSITNVVAVSLVWLWMFNPEYGLINTLLNWGGIRGPLWLQSEEWAIPSLVLMLDFLNGRPPVMMPTSVVVPLVTRCRFGTPPSP